MNLRTYLVQTSTWTERQKADMEGTVLPWVFHLMLKIVKPVLLSSFLTM